MNAWTVSREVIESGEEHKAVAEEEVGEDTAEEVHCLVLL